MKGIRKLGILVLGVVWVALVKKEVISVVQDRPWMKTIPEGDVTYKNVPECFGGRRGRERGSGTVMKVKQKWRTQTAKQWIEKGKPTFASDYEVKEQYAHLWLAGIAGRCSTKREETVDVDGMEREWCKVYTWWKGNNVVLRCPHTEHGEQFVIWSDLVENSQNYGAEQNVSFSEVSPEKQSFLCALNSSEESTAATENMPDTTQKIGDQNCELTETDPKNGDFANNCSYEMKWLGEKVASYTCPLRKPQNCSEVIRREYEKKNDIFGKSTPEIVDKTKNGKKGTWEGENCTLKTGSLSTDTGLKKFTFTNGGSDTKGEEIWCNSSGNEIKCRFVPQCEVVIKDQFNGQWNQRGIESGINYNGKDKTDELPKICNPKQNLDTGGRATMKKFKFTDSSDDEIWCTSPRIGGEITCRHLSPCAATVATKFEGKLKEIVEGEKFEYNGEESKNSGLPEKCTSKGNSNGGSTQKFQFGENNAKEFWCASSTETDPKNITCKFFSPCEVEVREALGSGVSEVLGLHFTVHKPEQQNLTGTNCSKKGEVTESGQKADFLFSFEEGKPHDGTLSCKNEAGKIDCTFSPNCAFTVKGAFYQGSPEKGNIDENGGLKLDEAECKKVVGKRSEDAQTFEITKGGEISCHIEDGNTIKCVQLSQCEIEVKKAFTKGNPSGIIFGGEVTNPKDQQQEGLDGKVCSKVGSEKGEEVFEFTSDAGNTHKGSEFSCKKSEGSKISCSLLPPRCQIVGMEGKNEPPLRCNKTNGNVTISGGIFADKMECEPKNETTFHDKHRTHCAINVTIGGNNETYVCDKEKSDLKDKSWCQKNPPPLAPICFQDGLKLRNGSLCKNHTGPINIPVSVLKQLNETCEVKEDGRTGEENKCKMDIIVGEESNGKGKMTYLCENNTLEQKIDKLCTEVIIPWQNKINSTNKKETVRLLFHTEDTTGDGNVGTRIEKRNLSLFVLSPPDPWDTEEGTSASFNSSPLSFLLLALF